MGHYRIIVKKTAREDLSKHKRSGNKKNLINIYRIIKELKIHPYTGTGKPEPLKYELKGLWSRRINKKDRLVYEVAERTVIAYLFTAINHYEEK